MADASMKAKLVDHGDWRGWFKCVIAPC